MGVGGEGRARARAGFGEILVPIAPARAAGPRGAETCGAGPPSRTLGRIELPYLPMSSEASSFPVRLQREGAVAVLELNRPQALNVVDLPTARAFVAACRELSADASVRAVLLCGAGRSFGVGGDLRAMAAGDAGAVAGELIGALHESVQRLAALDAPVVAALQGVVAGGSWSLALAADLAVAADDASFTLAYAQIGASCDVNASWALPRMVGLRRALQIALLGERLSAAQALEWGLVNRVVPAAQLREQALALAQQLAQGPTLAYGRLKRLMRESLEHSLGGQLERERQTFLQGTRTQDFAQGVAAFLEKRPARFEGR